VKLAERPVANGTHELMVLDVNVFMAIH
jgi:hypothetical protein